MHEVGVVRVVIALVIDHRDVVIDDQVDFRHVDSPCQHIGGDERGEDSLTEVVNDSVTLSILKTSYEYLGSDVLRVQLCLELRRVVLFVDKHHRHGSFQVSVQLGYEVNLFCLFHQQFEILYAF